MKKSFDSPYYAANTHLLPAREDSVSLANRAEKQVLLVKLPWESRLHVAVVVTRTTERSGPFNTYSPSDAA